MNANELRDHLREIAKTQGLKNLTPDEIDFMNNKITFQTYQNRCYSEYCKGKLSKRVSKNLTDKRNLFDCM